LQQNGLQCDADAIKFLAEFVEGNLLAADQEIIKLSLLYEGEMLSVNQILAAVSDNSRYKGFDLFDNVLKGQTSHVMAMLKSFEQDGTAIVWLLFIIAKEIRMLATIDAYQQQMNLPLAMKKVYIFAQRKPLIETVLRQPNKINWNDCILQLAEIDKQIKGVISGNPWLSLNTVLVGISQHINNS